MSPKRRVDTHVPRITEVITEPLLPSTLERTAARTAKKPVTLESLADDLENLKTQIAIMVEWLQNLDERTASGD